jgi:spore maturation protein CgeB
MYQVLRRTRITMNSHIDPAGAEAENMRLVEAARFYSRISRTI